MGGIRVLSSNLALTATLTASSEATGHAATNLNSSSRFRDWRSSTATSEATMQFDFGSAKQLYGFGAIDATTFAGGGISVEYKQNSGDPWTVLAPLPFPAFNPTNTAVLWRSVSARYVLYRFTNPAAVSAYAQLGVAFIAGALLKPARSVAPGAAVHRVDPSEHRRSIGGQRSSVVRSKYHVMDFTFHLRSTFERDGLAQLFNTLGTTEPAIWALDPDDWRVVYGVLATPFEAAHRSGTVDLTDIGCQVVEDL
jgi:hypothetical protein